MQEGQEGEEHIPILRIVVVYEQEAVGLATGQFIACCRWLSSNRSGKLLVVICVE
jgi:hypothetical protein